MLGDLVHSRFAKRFAPERREIAGEQQTNESDEQGPKLIGFIPPAAIATDAPGW
jgi:hypothetical protein